VLNPDLEFRFGNPFPALLEDVAADLRIGAVAPVLLQPGTLHAEPLRSAVTPIELIKRRLPGFRPPSEPDWLVGAFIMFRTVSFAELGGFDKRFRLYCEDVDIGMRLLASGWRINRSANAYVVHLTARRSHRRINYTLMHFRSLLQLWIKMARSIYTLP
jgi:GT2 family glycosyltransferase